MQGNLCYTAIMEISKDHYGLLTGIIHAPENPILDLPAKFIHGTRNVLFDTLNIKILTQIARHVI